ncbi:MAG: EamA family transporter [Hyphomicrobiaceae bacterium]|nr:EamA family transporter [Hyphomicrobiaceae bacterium]
MTGIETALVISVVAAITTGQVLFKTAAGALGEGGLLSVLNNPRAAMVLFAALAIYGLATLAWIVVLKSVPLSRAYLFMALSFAIVPVCAHFFFGEPLSWQVLAGSGMVVSGIMLAASAA